MDYIYSIQKKKCASKSPILSNNSKLLLHAFFPNFFYFSFFSASKASWQSNFSGVQFVHVFFSVQCSMQMEVHTDFDCPFDGLYSTILSDMYSNCDKHRYWTRSANRSSGLGLNEIEEKIRISITRFLILSLQHTSEYIKITSKALTSTKMARCM